MSVALFEHTGPWTPDDVEASPDAGDHARYEVYEVYEGGVLVGSPTLTRGRYVTRTTLTGGHGAGSPGRSLSS